MYTFCNYTRAELLEADGRTFWATFKNKTMQGAIKVLDNSIYLLHNCGGIGPIGYNLSDEDREGYMYDWCIFDDTHFYDEVDNLWYLFKDFAISKESPVKKQKKQKQKQKKEFKLQATQAGDKCIELEAVDAKTEEHLKYLLSVTDGGIYMYGDARPKEEDYNIPQGMFDKDGFIRIKEYVY